MGHLTELERYQIECDFRLGMSCRQIARHLGRSVRTVQRERQRGWDARLGVYRMDKALRARAQAGARSAANHPTKSAALWARLTAALCKRHSPAQAIGSLGLRLSVSAAYRWLVRAGLRYARYLRHGLRSRKRRAGNPALGWLKAALPIAKRPALARARLQLGHLEGDSLVGRRNEPCKVLGLIDRASGKVYLGWVPDGSAAAVAAHVGAFMRTGGVRLHSLTCDRGSEFTRLPALLPGKLYVCEPGKPYQKGAIENLFGLLRQYLPKGQSLRQVTQAKLDAIAEQLNHRPRRRLAWQSPSMIHTAMSSAATV